MWLKSELEDAREIYQQIKNVGVDELLDNDEEREAVDFNAVSSNIRNVIIAPRKLHLLMTTIRCQYLCIDS